MNIKFLLLVFSAAAISSCSSIYRSGQTPDDVYYSPGRVEEDETSERKREQVRDHYQDRGIRMAVYDRRWRDFNDEYDNKYDPYHYGYTYGYYYNPYYCQYPVYFGNVTITNPRNSVPRMTSLGSYNNTSYIVTNIKKGNGDWISNPRPYNISNTNSTYIRRILSTAVNNNNNSNNSSSSENNTRSYSPSSSSSSSGSSGSSSGSVSRPGRGN